ncbi:hypothetical protein G8759_18810 [Spirosoma aureum]|uniref:Uncharacterized protein n=1 Tax=Spirosoma aureum TaxID=2692134 RepID=A0A6G9APW7_9BACT|nr:hypothetical protein [Spirosoma aureum]QIP14517.1 hypothetical protein G8759_18810 [Spirosoma aureum]
MTPAQQNILSLVCLLVIMAYTIAKYVDSQSIVRWSSKQAHNDQLSPDSLQKNQQRLADIVSLNADPRRKQKIKDFNDIASLQTHLSRIGTGKLHGWRQADLGWLSLGDVYHFGSPGPNGLRNNFSLSLQSPSESSIQTLTLKVNLNNPNQKHILLMEYASIGQSTLKAIGITAPVGLLTALLNGDPFEDENDQRLIRNVFEPGRIDSWKLIVVSH